MSKLVTRNANIKHNAIRRRSARRVVWYIMSFYFNRENVFLHVTCTSYTSSENQIKFIFMFEQHYYCYLVSLSLQISYIFTCIFFHELCCIRYSTPCQTIHMSYTTCIIAFVSTCIEGFLMFEMKMSNSCLQLSENNCWVSISSRDWPCLLKLIDNFEKESICQQNFKPFPHCNRRKPEMYYRENNV